VTSRERIYLTGMMGVGKSTLGRRLADRLGWDFADLDEMIEKRAEMSVSSVFSQFGEDEFRRRESDAISVVASRMQCVISLGGGALLNEGNQKIVLRSGTLVYLMLSEGGLIGRLTNSESATRPLLVEPGTSSVVPDGNGDKKRKQIAELLYARAPGYKKAHVTVDLENYTEAESLEALLLALSGVGIIEI
jgi:shikimate kinase